ncbi:MAG: hypothetical protein CMJ52_11070 [Planctomycetaceae bacterium]|nr:hypothetical protein [Planctomycetaceae bacterium]
MDFDFQDPGAFRLLALVALLAIVATLGMLARRRALGRFATHPMLVRLAPHVSLFRPALRAGLATCALLALVLAIADPRWGVRYVDVDRGGGMDVIFAVDVSRSMLAGDATPNRLDRSRSLIEEAVETMTGDRVGLVDFAGTATVKSPLTLNYDAFEDALDELTPRSAARGGSMLGDAIRVAADAFGNDEPGGKAIVILTDGEDMGSFPVEAAEAARRDHGVRIYTVGIGDAEEGGRIPVSRDGQPGWLQYQNQEVWSKMDMPLLESVAAAGGGVFVPAGTSLVDLGEFFAEWITSIDLRDRDEGTARRTIPRFQWFAGVALVLMIMEMLIGERRRRPAKSTRLVESGRMTT